MRFVFTKLFYVLLALGLVPLSLSWGRPMLRWVALAYDLGLIAVAVFDAWNSKLPAKVSIERHFGGRFAVGAETEVRIEIANHTSRDIARPVLRHRLTLRAEAELDGATPDSVITDILQSAEVPR